MLEETYCPVCGSPGARKFLWVTKCNYPGCPTNKNKNIQKEKRQPLKGNFDPGANSIELRYKNYRGEDKTYTGDRSTLCRKGNYLSLFLVPTGRRCAFDRRRIQNLEEVESYLSEEKKLSATELQILGYHRKHGTTSPRYEEIKQKAGLTE